MTKETKVGLVIGLLFMVGVVYLLQWFTSGTGEPPIAPKDRKELAKVKDSRTKWIKDKPPLSATQGADAWRPGTKKTVDRVGPKKDDKTVKGMGVKTIFGGKEDSIAKKRDKPPVVKFYIVKEGQTLSEVAAEVYGAANGHEWQRIHKANKYKVPNPHMIRPGLKLRIPPLVKSKPSPVEELLGLGGAGTYTVLQYDTLSEISSRKLGTARRWREILALNKDKLSSEYGLRAGMVLRLPAAKEK